MYGSAYRCPDGQGECCCKSKYLLYYKLSLDNIYNVLDIPSHYRFNHNRVNAEVDGHESLRKLYAKGIHK